MTSAPKLSSIRTGFGQYSAGIVGLCDVWLTESLDAGLAGMRAAEVASPVGARLKPLRGSAGRRAGCRG